MLPITNHPLYKKHNIDSAMSSLWEFYKSRFLSLFLISFAMSLITQYGSSFIDLKEIQTLVDPKNTPDPMAILEKLKDYIVPMLILAAVSLFFSNILHYYILRKPLDDSKNILVSLLESLKYFIPYLIILIILALVGSFAIALGFMVIIIGVIFSVVYLMMIYFFILPVMMTEGINIGRVIVRTARLSHRNFWSNIGWTSVFLVLYIIVSLIFSTIIMVPFTGDFLKTILNSGADSNITDLAANPVFIILSSAANALTMPLIPILGFILYFNGKAGEDVVQSPLYGDDNYKVRVEDLYSKPVYEEKNDSSKKND
jgi:hypothetical protein